MSDTAVILFSLNNCAATFKSEIICNSNTAVTGAINIYTTVSGAIAHIMQLTVLLILRSTAVPVLSYHFSKPLK